MNSPKELRNVARHMAKFGQIKYGEALNFIARDFGYADWAELLYYYSRFSGTYRRADEQNDRHL